MKITKKKIILIVIISIIFIIALTSGISVYATTTYLASQINYNRDDNTITVASALNELYDMSQLENDVETLETKTGKVLWANNDTAISVNETITLSSDDYDILEFYYLDQHSGMQVNKILKGYDVCLITPMDANGLSAGYRNLTRLTDTTYKVGTSYCCWHNGTKQLGYESCVPIKIIGYKL